MISKSRRNFLRGVWRAQPLPVAAESMALTSGDELPGLLPPEFSPAMLRLEGQRLGLPVDTMDKEALVRAVAQAMRAPGRPSV